MGPISPFRLATTGNGGSSSMGSVKVRGILYVMMIFSQILVPPTKAFLLRQHQTKQILHKQWKLFSSSPKTKATSSGSSKRKTSNTPSSQTSDPSENHWLPSVILRRNHQSKSFRNGNQLVFDKAVEREPPSLKMGQLVQLLVEPEAKTNNKSGAQAPMDLLGWGVYNPNSLYRFRILGHRFLMPRNQYQKLLETIDSQEKDPETSNKDKQSKVLSVILDYQLRKALLTRKAIQLLPKKGGDTDTFRLVNGEGDSLSGLAIDVIGGKTGVVMSSAAWCEMHKATILSSLSSLLDQDAQNMDWVWKTTASRLKQDGFDPSEFGIDETNEDSGYDDKKDTMVLSKENGIQYATWPYQDGQKTGVYCDQRENRRYLASPEFCQGKRVLDLCCYHGGFSLSALIHGGASHATGVDSSQDAVTACWENAKLNGFSDDSRVEFVRSDITPFLQNAVEQQRFYDVVVLDPPKLAPSVGALEKARRKYHSFNRDAIKVVDPVEGGLLMTCTCSAAMTQKDAGQYFLSMVQGAALAAGREVTLLRVSGAAPCHVMSPVSWPAGAYLTAALFRVHPTNAP